MCPNEHDVFERDDSLHHGRFELFYYERIGSRSYLRFTRLTLFLIVGLMVVSMLMLFALFTWNSSEKPKPVNVNISVPPATPYDYSKPIIRASPPARTIPKPTMPARPSIKLNPAPAVDDNKTAKPRSKPSSTPVRAPT